MSIFDKVKALFVKKETPKEVIPPGVLHDAEVLARHQQDDVLIETLDPVFQPIAISIMEEAERALYVLGYGIKVVSARRTAAEQNKLYAQGRIAPGAIVTKARAGQSSHNYGMAFDFCILKDGKEWWVAPKSLWSLVGDIAKAKGMEWGGDFTSIVDMPHIQHPDYYALREKWEAGEIKIV